ncbi:MAG TPA: tetratricopeptide repeat protein [Ktedonobacteraceae bacterium]
MRQLPTGTLTLLFTDIEGSTLLLQQLGSSYAEMLRECRRLLRAAFQQWHGHEVDTQGDAFFVVFERAADAISAAVAAQQSLFKARWPGGAIVRVRMGIHTGELQPTEEGYVGLDVHRAARIMNAAHGTQVLLSQATCDLVVSELPEDVSLSDLGEYRLKDIAGFTRLFQLVIPGLPAEFPTPSTPSLHRPLRSIPSLSTSFVGREQEITAICAQLRRTDMRLLTLFGTAGVGKTRLALQVATELVEQFADGICFVALEQFSNTDEVMIAIAQAVGVQQEKGRSLLEQVKETLHGQSMLLVLDNFEQVLSARLAVADLLAGCPELKVLVTSRVMLHLRAEQLFELTPLPLPSSGHPVDVKALSHYASIALFVQRAQAVAPDFQLTSVNAAAVAGICTRLDGIPLAIELAAARTRHFSPHILLAQLEKGLAVLYGKAQDVPARQQTLHGAIAWSYDLLEPVEQGVFRRLAVFANGAALVATEQVCTAAGAIVGNILHVLEELVDKSMVQRQELKNGEMRVWLLQTLREFGVACLSQAGELAATQAAHAAYFLSWMEQVAPMLLGAEQADWLDQLDREYENVRVALEWMLDGTGIEIGRAEQALRLCVALTAFWEIRGYIREGLAFMERALALGKDAAPSVRAQVLHYAGFLALMQDDDTRAEEFLRESQLLFRDSGDKFGMANILRLQGNLAMMKNNYKIARRLLEEALNIYQTLGDMRRAALTRDALAQVAIAQGDYTKALLLLEENLAYSKIRGEQYGTAYPLCHMALALFLSRGDKAKARELAEESLALFRAVGNRRFIAHVLILLGEILLVEREDDRARSMLEESLSIFKVMGERSGSAAALISLARVLAYRGEHETALSFYKESWELLQAIGDRELAAACLEGYGQVLVAQGETRRAVQLWGIAATVRAAIVAPMPPIYRSDYIQAVAAARESLSEEAFQAAWTEGNRTPLEQGL